MELDLSWAKIWLNTLKADSKSHSYYYGYVIEQEELKTLHELLSIFFISTVTIYPQPTVRLVSD